jgi:uncharacterized caspase-like protein
MDAFSFCPWKKALVIGINEYVGAKYSLSTCVADATDLSDILRSIGFEIFQGLNCTMTEFEHKVEEFVQKIKKEDTILFYFAGHGVQADDKNYLIPSDYKYDCRSVENTYLSNNAIVTQNILHRITAKCPRVTIFILDCCRTQRISQTCKPGLSTMNPTPKTLFVFSCGPGQKALPETRNRRNSVFGEHLLRHIATPDIDFDSLLMRVASDVLQATHGNQISYRTSTLTKRVILAEITPIGKILFHSIRRHDHNVCSHIFDSLGMYVTMELSSFPLLIISESKVIY